ncbi:MAG: DUF3089 domain-containing protein [Bacteroidota bacterium]
MKPVYLLFFMLLLAACATKPKGDFSTPPVLIAPDYSNPDHWAALPSKEDMADRVPEPSLTDNQASAAVDVFFLHPTTYNGSKGDKYWNGPINDPELNERTDESTILNQASIFNGAGRVYAPRYRQAHLNAYYSDNKVAAKKAFALAYQDVKKAFEYYLANYNDGRPIIMAAHSQGTTHLGPLMKEFFDGKALQKQLVAAYAVGMPVAKDFFENIPPCATPEATGCLISWRSYKKGYLPKGHKSNNNLLVTNPLVWVTDDTYAPKDLNSGAVLRNFDKGLWEDLADAQVNDGLLWVTKPKFPGSFLITFKNYHIADYNFYYNNVRENAMLRAKQFTSKLRKENKAVPSN